MSRGVRLPIFLEVTVETTVEITGTMLMGSEIGAAMLPLVTDSTEPPVQRRQGWLPGLGAGAGRAARAMRRPAAARELAAAVRNVVNVTCCLT